MIDSLIERLNSLKCEAEVANYSPSYSAGIEASIAVVRQHQTTPSQEANYWKTRYLLLKGKTEPVSSLIDKEILAFAETQPVSGYHRGFNDGLKGACARAEAHSKNNNLTGKCASKGTFRAHGAPESEAESGARGAQPTEQPDDCRAAFEKWLGAKRERDHSDRYVDNWTQGLWTGWAGAWHHKRELLNPDMPAQELRLHMGELSPDEVRVARAAIAWANTRIEGQQP
jgi:hypothetical protein